MKNRILKMKRRLGKKQMKAEENYFKKKDKNIKFRIKNNNVLENNIYVCVCVCVCVCGYINT